MPLQQKATHRQTRRVNERLVLRTLYNRAPTSRAEVARVTGLTRTTVSDVVDRLLEDGLAEEVGLGPSTGGKAPILLRVPADARHVIGVDVDDHQLSGAVVNLVGQIRHREAVPLRGRDGDLALRGLDSLVDGLLAAADRPLLGVGVGTPGLVDTARGTVRWAVNLDWRDVPLGARLRERTGLPVSVVNDSQAAALAEWTFGGHAGQAGMIVVKVGQGIGAGIIVEGRLYQGESHGAGEIGHTAATDDGTPCRCGRAGCLETVAGVAAVRRLAGRLAAGGQGATPGIDAAPDLETLVAAVRSKDPGALVIVTEAGRHLGRALGALIGALDIHEIVLIGPMTRFGEPWLAAVREEAGRSALSLLADRTQIQIGRVGADLVERGAAALLMSSELGLSLAA